MSKDNTSNRVTTDWYDREAQAYKKRTDAAEMEAIYTKFLDGLPKGSRILDLGCGPGRDMAAFKARGYRVEGVDGAEGMVDLARRRLGAETRVTHSSFADWQPDQGRYDAIWACASLMFVPPDQMAETLAKARKALKPGGKLYIAVKHGQGERLEDDVRRVWLWTTQTLSQHLPGFDIDITWTTGDASPQRRQVKWLNLLARRKRPEPSITPRM
ncbi:MAG: class I SAM-dependent methyltransferase [Alphaproteobacteria bacterium]